jgi:hypothetical protein
MRFAVCTSQQLTVVLLGGFGVLMRLALAPRYWPATPGMDPQGLWQAAGATALFIAGSGRPGYATRRDLTAIAQSGLPGRCWRSSRSA